MTYIKNSSLGSRCGKKDHPAQASSPRSGCSLRSRPSANALWWLCHREARPSDPKDEKMKKETYMEPGGSGQCACAQLLKSTIIHKRCACAQLCGLRGSRAKRDPVRALVASKFGPRGTLRSSDLCQLTLLEALIHIFSNSFFTATPSIFMGFCICHNQILAPYGLLYVRIH